MATLKLGLAELVAGIIAAATAGTQQVTVTFTAAATVLGRSVALGLLVGDVSRCDTCRALVIKADQDGHMAWHTQIALAAARPIYGEGGYQAATVEQLAAGK